jgi:hypothetical protein
MQAFLDHYGAYTSHISLRSIDLTPRVALGGMSGAGVQPSMLYMPGRAHAAGIPARPEVASPAAGENNCA